jgi:hypothetical protein
MKTKLNDSALHIKFSEKLLLFEDLNILKSGLSESIKNKDLYKSLYYLNCLFYSSYKVSGKYKNSD